MYATSEKTKLTVLRKDLQQRGISKALGIGISSGLNFKEIIIKNLTSGNQN